MHIYPPNLKFSHMPKTAQLNTEDWVDLFINLSVGVKITSFQKIWVSYHRGHTEYVIQKHKSVPC